MIQDYFKLAIKNIRKRKLRSWLTVLGIIISIATIFVLISLSLGLQEAVQEQFRLLGTDKLIIQPKGQTGPTNSGAVSFTTKDADVVKKVSGIKRVTFWTIGNAKIEHDKAVKFVMVIGIDLDSADLFTELGSYKAEDGRLLKKGDVKSIMIGYRYKHENFLNKPIKIGDIITVQGEPFKVRGILQTLGNPSDDSLIYMPLEDFRSLFNKPDQIDTIIAQIGPNQDIKQIASKVEKKLASSRGLKTDNTDFVILTPEELLTSFGNILSIVTAFLAGIAGISLLVGATNIANTMFTSVLERTKEIGVMKAIGAKNSDIMIIFLIESGLLGLIGGVIGVLLGMGIGKSIEYYAVTYLGTNLLRVSSPTYLIMGCLLFGFLIGSFSGAIPSYRASRTNPVDALRYE